MEKSGSYVVFEVVKDYAGTTSVPQMYRLLYFLGDTLSRLSFQRFQLLSRYITVRDLALEKKKYFCILY